MTVLLIGDAERSCIAALRAKAAASVVEASVAIRRARRDPAAWRIRMARLTIRLPENYWVTYSHERQPLGLYAHISISLDEPRKLPSVPAVEMILEEFGMRPLSESAVIWAERIDPATQAVNVLQSLEATAAHVIH